MDKFLCFKPPKCWESITGEAFTAAGLELVVGTRMTLNFRLLLLHLSGAGLQV